MIYNKTVITLILIILNIKNVASTSPSDPSKKKIKKTDSLQDMNNQVTDVPAEGGTLGQVDQVEEQSVPVINEHFKGLIERGEYDEIRRLAKTIDKDKFITQICPVVKTHEQYMKLKDCFKHHGMVEHFYVYGDMTVVKDAIIIGNPFDDNRQAKELQRAVGLALEKDKHERVCQLLKIRQDGTAEKDKNRRKGCRTSFEIFLWVLFSVLAFWKNTKPLARFITFYGKKFSEKYPDTYAIFCEGLVEATCGRCSPIYRKDNESAKKFLSDLVGQPSLLTAVTFTRGFLYSQNVFYRTGFIEYGWREAIKEGLSGKYPGGGEPLWNALKEKYPKQCSEDYPPSVKTLDAVLKLFPTKREREEAWTEAHAPIPRKELESLNLELNLFPKVLWILISEYNALLWSEVC